MNNQSVSDGRRITWMGRFLLLGLGVTTWIYARSCILRWGQESYDHNLKSVAFYCLVLGLLGLILVASALLCLVMVLSIMRAVLFAKPSAPVHELVKKRRAAIGHRYELERK